MAWTVAFVLTVWPSCALKCQPEHLTWSMLIVLNCTSPTSTDLETDFKRQASGNATPLLNSIVLFVWSNQWREYLIGVMNTLNWHISGRGSVTYNLRCDRIDWFCLEKDIDPCPKPEMICGGKSMNHGTWSTRCTKSSRTVLVIIAQWRATSCKI